MQVDREICGVCPSFTDEHPSIMFTLRQQHYHTLIRQNKMQEAVLYARTKLGPLAQAHPELIPPLQVGFAWHIY